MDFRRTLFGTALCALGLAVLANPAPLAAQGVTTAAIGGTVSGTDGNPIESVTVTVRNESTGILNGSLTDDDGDYLVPGLQIGGPYTVEAGAGELGYTPESRSGIQLTLGQRLDLDFVLATDAVQVEGITATINTTDQIINPSRTGQETLISENQIANYPSITRNFTDFVGSSPLSGTGGGATAIGGANNRFNSIQLDGVVTQDLFGLGSTGQPGGQAGARSISIEAVKMYQIIAAPFDVRQAGFTGGLINAVTKTGGNDWGGSVYGYFRNESFVREKLEVDGTDVEFGEFDNQLYGGTFSGPIVRDRVHFFTAVEVERDERPGGEVTIGVNTPAEAHVTTADVEAIASRIGALGGNPGGFGRFTVKNPNTNLFGRVDAQLNQNHLLTVRHNYVRAEDDVVQNRFGGSTYSFDSNFYFFETTTNSFVSALNSTFGNSGFNELTFGYTRIRDRRTPRETFPEVNVRVADADGSGTTTVRMGAEFFSQANELDQDSWEISNNLSFDLGDNHRVTLGVQDQIFKFRNLFLSGATGSWSFDNLDDFLAGDPASFRRNILHSSVDDPNARFSVNNFSIYGQTEYRGFENVVLTGGLRYDVPFMLDDAIRNPPVEQLGRTTSEMPSGNGVLSPRLGFNWDVNGEGITQVRGGVGLFTGRQPFVWLSNLYTNTGLFSGTLTCSGDNVPTFTLDPNSQPNACGSASPSFPTPAVNTVDPDFEFPSVWRFDAAVDRELPWNVVGTVEFVYSKYNKQIILKELNVDFDNPVSTTQGGRPVFGTHKAGLRGSTPQNQIATPNRITSEFLQVVDITNSDQDRAWNLIFQAQKRYSDGFQLSASYTLSDAEDISGLTSSIATSNIGFNPTAGSPNDLPLATSDYIQRHKLSLGGIWDVAEWLTWSMFYSSNTGDQYSYVYDGDVNADGYENVAASNRFNDLLYVPRDASDITLVDPADWDELDAYISTEECLNENRGQIIERNVCKEPWRHRVDTRFTFKIPTVAGQHGELVLDVFNVLNLLNQDWGRNEGVAFAAIDLLELEGWDVANNRGIFDLDQVNLDEAGRADPLTVFDVSSRWQAQIGFRYEIN
ncbi:MAG TPA: carboxypeptidase regulatory-like domain-containing protein [Gemmatimonadota bacterium]|nr:carboxypeptidase regulatory-like domain-containing protein [Gemmatimonadota bacterium]